MNTACCCRTYLLSAILLPLAVMVAPALAFDDDIDPPIARQIMLRLRAGVNINEFVARYAEFDDDEPLIFSISSRNIYTLLLDNGVGEELFIKQKLDQDADVKWAEQNYGANAPEGTGQNFFCRPVKNNARYVGQPLIKQLNVQGAHEESTGQGVLVAVVDTGVDATHEALVGRVRDDGWNFVDGNADTRDVGNNADDDGDGTIDEMTGHGTHVAGLVALLAPDAEILPIKVLDSDGHADVVKLAAGIFFAIDKGADVINISIGSTYDAEAVELAVEEARSKGIVVIAAAGNEKRGKPEEFPAMNTEPLGIAAVDENDVKWEFSNYSPPPDPKKPVQLALSAPGQHISSAIPDNTYAEMSGTSMSTAIVSGVAALVLAKHPEWTRNATRVDNVTAFLQAAAVNIDDLNPEYVGKLGAGRIDAGTAVKISVAFDKHEEYDVGTLPAGIAVADLNGDGLDDIATANEGSNSISVLINQGDGTFPDVPVNYPVGAGPVSIVAAQLDGAGGIDLAVVNGDSRNLSVLINKGGGTFETARTLPGVGEPEAITAGDVDGDEDIDLVTANGDGNTVTVYENDGQGGFTIARTLPVGQRPTAVILARLNGDQHLDIATANRRSDNLSVLLNNGDGTFAAARHYGGLDEPRSLAAGDFDGDDDMDIAVANKGTAEIVVLSNNGGAVFAITGRIALGGERRPETVIAAELNCDGAMDLMATSGELGEGFVSVLINKEGSFEAAFAFEVGVDPQGAAAGRFDRDADLDLAVANAGGGTISVLRNQTCAGYAEGDLNCDGSLNLVDVQPFILALIDPAGYWDRYPECDLDLADLNSDGSIDLTDVEPFVELLIGP